jgi:hypothetical protein
MRIHLGFCTVFRQTALQVLKKGLRGRECLAGTRGIGTFSLSETLR